MTLVKLIIEGTIWFLSLTFLGLALYLRGQFWESIGLDQLLFHLAFGLDGLHGVDEKFYLSLAIHVLIGPALILLSALFFKEASKKVGENKVLLLPGWILFVSVLMAPFWKYALGIISAEHTLTPSLLLNDELTVLFLCQFLIPGLLVLMSSLSKKTGRYLSFSKGIGGIALILSFLTLCWSTNAFSFFYQRWFGKDLFSKAYYPIGALPKTIKKRNLVIIYFESLERRFENKDMFGENLLADLVGLPGQQVEHFHSAPGTGWSMAGMAASQCSVPLKLFQVSLFEKMEFLPGLTCVSDLLKRFGYLQFFLVGTDSKFQGMRNFFKDHSYQASFGSEHWKRIGYQSQQLASWGQGLHDNHLFEEAKALIKRLRKTDQNFNITLMTADSHFPHGTPAFECDPREKKSDFMGATKCSSRWVKHFVNWMKEQKFLNDTILILMGDHLFLPGPGQQKYFEGHRDIFFKLISPVDKKISRTKMTHFDVAPTVLQLLGILPEGSERFGLGVSLFSRGLDAYEKQYEMAMDPSILNTSDTYDRFFKTP